MCQGIGNGFGRNAGPAQARQGHVQAAFLRIPGALVDGAAADVVAVFGQVGQVGKIGEGTDHTHRLVAREAFEQFLERLVRFMVGVAPEGDRQGADLFN